jgi:hypothetical protein
MHIWIYFQANRPASFIYNTAMGEHFHLIRVSPKQGISITLYFECSTQIHVRDSTARKRKRKNGRKMELDSHRHHEIMRRDISAKCCPDLFELMSTLLS